MHTTTAPIRTSSRLLALVLSTLLAASFVVAQQGVANADIAFPNTERVEGTDAISIGVAASKRIFEEDAANVAVLARSDNFPDALAATSVASTYGGPLLFTPTNRLDTAVRNELARVLEAGDTVFLMGGENALSPAVEDALLAEGYQTERINGPTRIETAARATDFVMAELSRQGRSQQTAVLVRSHGNDNDDLIRGWVDSVACGGLAANNDYPILLTNPGEATLHTSTRNRLDIYDFTKVLICGGPSAVPIEHQTEVSSLNSGTTSTVRAAGRDRIETAVDVAARNGFWDQNDPTGEVYILVPGWDQNFAFGLAAAQLSDAFNAPLLLVSANEPRACEGTDRSRATLCYLGRVGDGSVAGLVAVGSTSIISDATFSSAAEAAGLEEDVTPPAVPDGVSATDTPEDDGSSIDVGWNAVTDDGSTVRYNVYFKASDETALTKANGTKANGTTPTTSTTFAVTGLTKDTAYDFAVTSIDQFGNESALSVVRTATPVDNAPAKPATAPTATSVAGGIRVGWEEAPEADAVGYRIQKATSHAVADCSTDVITGDGQGAKYATIEDGDGAPLVISPKSTTSYLDTDVEVGTEYCYRYAVQDTSAIVSPYSDNVGPTEYEAVPPPSSAPTVAPSLRAVAFDEVRGRVANPTGPSRITVDQAAAGFRVDTLIPAGAYASGETGRVRIFDNDSKTSVRDFTAPTSAATTPFVISVDVTDWRETVGTSALTAALESSSGETGPRSAVWSLEVVTPNATDGTVTSAGPIITVVNQTSIDPRAFRDGVPPTVGTSTQPQANPEPLVIIERVPTQNDFYVDIYNNGVRRFRGCYSVSTVRTGRIVINGGSPTSAEEGADGSDLDLDVFAGENRLTASILDATTTCSDGFLNTASTESSSGDSNTATYWLQTTATGLIGTTPSFGSVSPFGETFSAQFSQPVDSASLSLRRLSPAPDASPYLSTSTLAADARSITINRTSDPLAKRPGLYEMVVTFEPSGSAQRTETLQFHVGVTHALGLSGARGVNENNSITFEPVIVFDGSAPTGFYEAAYGSAADCSALPASPAVAAPDKDLTPEGDRRSSGAEQVPNFEQGKVRRVEARTSQGYTAGNTVCYRFTRLASATGELDAKTSVWQPDGALPVPVTNGAIGVATSGRSGTQFTLALQPGGAWPTATYDTGGTYAPELFVGLSGSTGNPVSNPATGGFAWTRAPIVGRDNVGALRTLTTDYVAIGGLPRYFTKDAYGNESVPVSNDGTFRSVSSITPVNASVPNQLNAGDSLVVDFSGGTLAASGTAPTGSGDLQLLANTSAVVANFGSAPTGSTYQLANNRLTITFGTSARVGSQSVPAAVTPPTKLNGGASVIGIYWLLDSDTGHSVLLPAAGTAAEAVNLSATW